MNLLKKLLKKATNVKYRLFATTGIMFILIHQPSVDEVGQRIYLGVHGPTLQTLKSASGPFVAQLASTAPW